MAVYLHEIKRIAMNSRRIRFVAAFWQVSAILPALCAEASYTVQSGGLAVNLGLEGTRPLRLCGSGTSRRDIFIERKYAVGNVG